MSMNEGMQTRSMPPAATYPREIAIALTAWLMAPAPIAWTSTRVWLRTTPAIAPATATGLEVADTFKISMAARAARGTPAAGLAESVFSPVEPFDGGVVSRVSIYSIEIGDRTFDWPPDTLTPSPGGVKRLLDDHLSIDPLHTGRLARKDIDFSQDRVELDHPFRHLEAVRDPG